MIDNLKIDHNILIMKKQIKSFQELWRVYKIMNKFMRGEYIAVYKCTNCYVN